MSEDVRCIVALTHQEHQVLWDSCRAKRKLKLTQPCSFSSTTQTHPVRNVSRSCCVWLHAVGLAQAHLQGRRPASFVQAAGV
eukprot:scaffold53489_cov15-Tisochrysis_lutea.AAC.2